MSNISICSKVVLWPRKSIDFLCNICSTLLGSVSSTNVSPNLMATEPQLISASARVPSAERRSLYGRMTKLHGIDASLMLKTVFEMDPTSRVESGTGVSLSAAVDRWEDDTTLASPPSPASHGGSLARTESDESEETLVKIGVSDVTFVTSSRSLMIFADRGEASRSNGPSNVSTLASNVTTASDSNANTVETLTSYPVVVPSVSPILSSNVTSQIHADLAAASSSAPSPFSTALRAARWIMLSIRARRSTSRRNGSIPG
mmetsp:Transcript_39016/g.58010  ORF Transcript_39016/g.58010 Transcript_39016/m.58010 type:complete len:260 (-) Transcript_39016:615-1394(-)